MKPVSFINLSDKFEIKIVANKTDDPQFHVIFDESFNRMIKPGVKHKMKIAFTPSALTNKKSSVVFSVHLINNKKVLAARSFMYDVHIHNCKNPFALDPIQLTRLYMGESWGTSLNIYNPYDKVLSKSIHVSYYLLGFQN